MRGLWDLGSGYSGGCLNGEDGSVGEFCIFSMHLLKRHFSDQSIFKR